MTEVDIDNTLSWDHEKFSMLLDWLESIIPNWTYNNDGTITFHKDTDATYFLLRFS